MNHSNQVPFLFDLPTQIPRKQSSSSTFSSSLQTFPGPDPSVRIDLIRFFNPPDPQDLEQRPHLPQASHWHGTDFKMK